MSKNNSIIGVIAIIIGVGLFYGGVKYGEAHTKSSTQARAAFFQNGQAGSRGANGFTGGQGGARGGAANAGFVTGSILSKDATSITVQLPGSGSKIVFLSASTTVSKMTDGSVSDLVNGTNVIVQGKANADGSITAQSIQLRPVGMVPNQNPRQ